MRNGALRTNRLRFMWLKMAEIFDLNLHYFYSLINVIRDSKVILVSNKYQG